MSNAPIRTESGIKLTASQKQAALLASNSANRYILYRGGSRSGKSYLISYLTLMRAISTPGSRTGIFRKTAASCRQTLFDLTFRNVMEDIWPGILKRCLISEAEATITLPNGSDPKNPWDGGAIFLFLGLDDGRRDKILGNEFSTIWINECTEVDYEHVEFLKTRLSQKLYQNRNDELGNPYPLKPKFFFDCNPHLKTSWEYKAFIKHINPTDNAQMNKPWQWVEAKLDPEGNIENIDPDYIEDTLGGMSARMKRRFLAGEWSDVNENALFKQADIDKARKDITIEDCRRTVIAVDPAVTNHAKSDMTGISVCTIGADGDFYVLADATCKASAEEWASKVAQLYRHYRADCIVVENNQGGDLVVANLRANGHKNLPIKQVRAFKGKELRAEPVSSLYANGRVHHPTCSLDDLEEQMGQFGSEHFKGSPDRVDALVYALIELGDLNGNEPQRGYQQIMAGGRNR